LPNQALTLDEVLIMIAGPTWRGSGFGRSTDCVAAPGPSRNDL
jgi:hypothetical protein